MILYVCELWQVIIIFLFFWYFFFIMIIDILWYYDNNNNTVITTYKHIIIMCIMCILYVLTKVWFVIIVNPYYVISFFGWLFTICYHKRFRIFSIKKWQFTIVFWRPDVLLYSIDCTNIVWFIKMKRNSSGILNFFSKKKLSILLLLLLQVNLSKMTILIINR